MPRKTKSKAKPAKKAAKGRAKSKSKGGSKSKQKASQSVNVNVIGGQGGGGGGAGGAGGGGAAAAPMPMPYYPVHHSFGTYEMGRPVRVNEIPDGRLARSDFGGGGTNPPTPRPPSAALQTSTKFYGGLESPPRSGPVSMEASIAAPPPPLRPPSPPSPPPGAGGPMRRERERAPRYQPYKVPGRNERLVANGAELARPASPSGVEAPMPPYGNIIYAPIPLAGVEEQPRAMSGSGVAWSSEPSKTGYTPAASSAGSMSGVSAAAKSARSRDGGSSSLSSSAASERLAIVSRPASMSGVSAASEPLAIVPRPAKSAASEPLMAVSQPTGVREPREWGPAPRQAERQRRTFANADGSPFITGVNIAGQEVAANITKGVMPRRPSRWDTEKDGTPAVMAAAQRTAATINAAGAAAAEIAKGVFGY